MPCDYSIYPINWKEIRARILARADNRCEECGVRNYVMGFRGEDDSFYECYPTCDIGEKIIKIIITIAHTCHTPQCDDENHLRALCQLHHNRLDGKHRAKNAARTRFARKSEESGQMKLIV